MAQSSEEATMDKNRTEGMKHEVKGAVKEATGKLTGNHAKEAAGNIEKNAGKVQKEVGKAADHARDRDRHHYARRGGADWPRPFRITPRPAQARV
jgi:uncharacterized protein YjbJ (UPF0337 family)